MGSRREHERAHARAEKARLGFAARDAAIADGTAARTPAEAARAEAQEAWASLTPPQKALVSYMEGQSEERWAAGWLSGLHESLKGDEGYDWLVEQAGGTFDHEHDAPAGANVRNYNGRDLAFVATVPS